MKTTRATARIRLDLGPPDRPVRPGGCAGRSTSWPQADDPGDRGGTGGPWCRTAKPVTRREGRRIAPGEEEPVGAEGVRMLMSAGLGTGDGAPVAPAGPVRRVPGSPLPPCAPFRPPFPSLRPGARRSARSPPLLPREPAAPAPEPAASAPEPAAVCPCAHRCPRRRAVRSGEGAASSRPLRSVVHPTVGDGPAEPTVRPRARRPRPRKHSGLAPVADDADAVVAEDDGVDGHRLAPVSVAAGPALEPERRSEVGGDSARPALRLSGHSASMRPSDSRLPSGPARCGPGGRGLSAGAWRRGAAGSR